MDFITIIAISNGAQYLYKFIRICGVYFSTVEIANKITFNKIYKHIDNVNTVYEATTFLLAVNQPKYEQPSNNKTKKNISSNNRKMKKLYSKLANLSHYIYIQKLERKEKRREKERNDLYQERKKRDEKNDKLNEYKLFDLGFYRDNTSRHYISPDKLLNDVHVAVVKNMTDPKWTMEDKTKIKNLICGDCSNLYEFKKYDELFYFADVLDRVTKRPFKCNLLRNEPVYSPKTIKLLQEKRECLTVLDVTDIETHNKCVD